MRGKCGAAQLNHRVDLVLVEQLDTLRSHVVVNAVVCNGVVALHHAVQDTLAQTAKNASHIKLHQ